MDSRRTLHLANVFFEEELADKSPFSFQAIKKNPVYLQLQFLPLLYAKAEDGIAVTAIPEGMQAHFHRLDGPISHYAQVDSWGASMAVAQWAQKHKLSYDIPPIDCVRTVNSKAFSYLEGKKLKNSALLYTTQEVLLWIDSFSGPKLLKTCFGVAGKGNLLIDERTNREKMLRFLELEWNAHRPVIGEPWVKRRLDFSTQWMIGKNKEIDFVGATLCENDERGRHVGNCVGNEKKLFRDNYLFLEMQKEESLPVLAKMAELGYFGHVGIDAMVYEGETSALHPIVEINARKTMGWVALKMLEKKPGQSFSLRYDRCHEGGLLPSSLEGVQFPRNIFTINIAT